MVIGLVECRVAVYDLPFPVMNANANEFITNLNRCVAAQATLQDPLAFLLSDEARATAQRAYVASLLWLVNYAHLDFDALRQNAANLYASLECSIEEMLEPDSLHGLWATTIARLANDVININYLVGLDKRNPIFQLKHTPRLPLGGRTAIAKMSGNDWRMFVEAVLASAALMQMDAGTRAFTEGTRARAQAIVSGYLTLLARTFPHFRMEGNPLAVWHGNIHQAATAYVASLS